MIQRDHVQPRTALVALWTVALALLTSCASSGGTATGGSAEWLSRKGFDGRGEWPSAALHLRRQHMRSTVRISELLRRVPDVRLQPQPGNPLGLTRFLDGNPGSCAVDVYLNGVRLAPRESDAQIDLDARVGVPDLDGLELHLGPGGPVYDPDECGSLLLWDQSLGHVDDQEFTGSIRGQIQNASSAPVSGVRIAPDGPLQRLDSAGVFHFPRLLPGEYRVELILSNQTVVGRDTRVYANTEAQVVMTVRRRRE